MSVEMGMIFAPGIELDQKYHTKESLKKAAIRPMLHLMAYNVVFCAEMMRWWNINEDGRAYLTELNGFAPKYVPDSEFKRFLQSSGDFYDGFNISLMTYWALSLPPLNKLSSEKRAVAAAVVAIAAVVATETGVRDWSTTATLNDIPMGVAGACLFPLVNYGISKLIDSKYKDKNI
jgi:hypothetical protein